MTVITKPVSRETGIEIRDGRKRRPILVELHPAGAVLRLKGTRKQLGVTWESIYLLAARIEGDRLRRERIAARKARKGSFSK